MNWYQLEKRLAPLAFPQLLRWITCIHVVIFVALLFQGSSHDPEGVFTFDWEKIKEGQYWRLFSFAFLPPLPPGSSLAIVFLFFAVMISFLMNGALETQWGVLRMTLYLYGLIVCQLLALITLSLIHPETLIQYHLTGARALYIAVFFAFAIFFPHYKFHLFMVLPVSVWILALISAVPIVLGSFVDPYYALFNLIALFPLLVWALPYGYKRLRSGGSAAVRRRQCKVSNKAREAEAFNTCHYCGRTDQSDPSLSFRIAEDGQEYCLDHLPKD